jgi:uncharacterized protein DUF2784
MAAGAVAIFHIGFVVFVALGGLLVWRWRRIAWLHLPCTVWGVLVQLKPFVCPLTPLEKHLRALGGLAPYRGGFIAHYIYPVLYPAGMTRGVQIALGLAVMVLNLAVYGGLILTRRSRSLARVTELPSS